MIYLDNNATTPLAPEVVEVMAEAQGKFGNASSVHALGQEARRLVNESRERIAAAFRVPESTLSFTSGGTEAVNAAILGVFLPLKEPSHLIVSRVEHSSVLQCASYLEKQGVDVSYLGVDSEGSIDPAQIEAALRPHTRLIAMMLANNEIGNIYPVRQIGEIARRHGVLYFCDAVQAVGKLEIDLSRLPIDLMAGAAHKFHGPKGVGFLYAKQDLQLSPLLHGGRQERGSRAGTENVTGIVGMATALDLALRAGLRDAGRVRRLRDRLQDGVLQRVPQVILHGDPEHRLDGTLNFRIEGVSGETM